MSPQKKTKRTLNATKKVARVVFSTIKKIGSSRGVTLRKIYDYIKEEYPNTQSNIVRLNNTLQKALAFGAITKKMGNRYVLGRVMTSLDNRRKYGIIQAKRRGKRRRSRRRSKSRRRRSRSRYRR